MYYNERNEHFYTSKVELFFKVVSSWSIEYKKMVLDKSILILNRSFKKVRFLGFKFYLIILFTLLVRNIDFKKVRVSMIDFYQTSNFAEFTRNFDRTSFSLLPCGRRIKLKRIQRKAYFSLEDLGHGTMNFPTLMVLPSHRFPDDCALRPLRLLWPWCLLRLEPISGSSSSSSSWSWSTVRCSVVSSSRRRCSSFSLLDEDCLGGGGAGCRGLLADDDPCWLLEDEPFIDFQPSRLPNMASSPGNTKNLMRIAF